MDLKYLRELYAKPVYQALFGATGSLNGRMKIPVLCYHSIDNSNARFLSISEKEFYGQIAYLKQRGYRTISLLDLIDRRFTEDKKNLENAVVITFDDGYRNNYTWTYPILKSFGFTATFFL